MKHRILMAYPVRLAFLLTAGCLALIILQVRNVLGFPARLRRALR